MLNYYERANNWSGGVCGVCPVAVA